jgi:hypothetical protein
MFDYCITFSKEIAMLPEKQAPSGKIILLGFNMLIAAETANTDLPPSEISLPLYRFSIDILLGSKYDCKKPVRSHLTW